MNTLIRIEGIVEGGKRLGRTIGFPTANLSPRERHPIDLKGVYAAWFILGERRLPCMVNIGHHPTLPEGAPTIEAHIFDFAEDIYGREAAIEPVAFLRGEQKFPSVEALREQLARDKITALEKLKA